MRSIRKKNPPKSKPFSASVSEDSIHRAILIYLDRVLPNGATPAWHTPNGGKRGIATARKMKALGTRAGFPDLAFLWQGKFYALEVKTSTGNQREAQKDWQGYITTSGGFYAIVRSIDDTKAQLKSWGVI